MVYLHSRQCVTVLLVKPRCHVRQWLAKRRVRNSSYTAMIIYISLLTRELKSNLYSTQAELWNTISESQLLGN